MVEVKPARMDPNFAPQNVETCKGCGHTHNFHLSTTIVGGFEYIEGHPTPCRWNGCPCALWKPSWGA